MKTLLTALVLSATVMGGAQAANLSEAPTISRAQVVAELAAARANGEIPQGEQAYPVIHASSAVESRAQVVAELQAAVANGQIQRGEEDYTVAANTSGSALSRAQVVEELRVAKANGEVTTGEANNIPVFAAGSGPVNRGQALFDAAERTNS